MLGLHPHGMAALCLFSLLQFYLLIETKRIRHKLYQLMKSSPWNYITDITHVHMKKSMHINESIPVTITHVKENKKTV